MISRRGAGFVGAAVVGILLAVYTLNLIVLVGALAIFAAVGGELVYFHLATPPASELEFGVRRTGARRGLSPGATAEIALEITYLGARPIFAELRDLLPSTLPRDSGTTALKRWWHPGDRATIGYAVRAAGRGSHLVGPVAVTLRSPHALAWVQRILPESEEPIRVVPPAPIARSQRLGPALLTGMQGRLALRQRGFGSEFRSLRPYQLTDDLRHVAWKRSRPGAWQVREFDQENRQDFVLLLDVSEGMLAGLPGQNALDRAIEAASLVLAAVARNGEDRVGLLSYAGRPRQYFAPARGEFHFRRLAENLAFLQPVDGLFDLGAALDLLTRRLTTNAHVLAFTALDGPLAPVRPAHLKFRSRGHHLYLFPPNRAGFYPPLPEGRAGELALRWAEAEERARLGRSVAELRAEGIPVFPYDRRGATGPVLTAYGRLRAWGLA